MCRVKLDVSWNIRGSLQRFLIIPSVYHWQYSFTKTGIWNKIVGTSQLLFENSLTIEERIPPCRDRRRRCSCGWPADGGRCASANCSCIRCSGSEKSIKFPLEIKLFFSAGKCTNAGWRMFSCLIRVCGSNVYLNIDVAVEEYVLLLDGRGWLGTCSRKHPVVRVSNAHLNTDKRWKERGKNGGFFFSKSWFWKSRIGIGIAIDQNCPDS